MFLGLKNAKSSASLYRLRNDLHHLYVYILEYRVKRAAYFFFIENIKKVDSLGRVGGF